MNIADKKEKSGRVEIMGEKIKMEKGRGKEKRDENKKIK